MDSDALAPTGATYFVHRLHEQRAVPPVHVHVTYTMGADFGKLFRLKVAPVDCMLIAC